MNDLISRRAAIKAIDDLPNCPNGYSDTYDKAYIRGVIEELPNNGCEYWDGESNFCALHRPADSMKYGKWIDHVRDYWCSECGGRIQKEQAKMFSICPYCGARMDEEGAKMNDLISRQAAIKEIEGFYPPKVANESEAEAINRVGWECAINCIEAYLRTVKPIDPVKHGKWELAEDGWYCTACKEYAPFDCDPEEKGIPYCPNCGAREDL